MPPLTEIVQRMLQTEWNHGPPSLIVEMGSFFVSFIKQIMGGHDMDAQEKYEKLQQILQNMQSVVIALSGGVDNVYCAKATF